MYFRGVIYYYFLLLVILIVLIAALKIYEKNVLEKSISRAGEFFNEQIEIYKNEMEINSGSEINIRYIKHDLKNHLIGIKAYILENDGDGAVKYIDELLEKKETQGPSRVQCGNLAVDAIVNNKIKTARDMDVDIISHVSMPENVCVDAAAICVILGNLLDNAIEAASGLAENKKVYLDILYHKCALIFRVQNQYSGTLVKNAYNNYTTSKNDAINHGLGLASVKNTVKQHDGDFFISAKGNEFSVQVVLYEK